MKLTESDLDRRIRENAYFQPHRLDPALLIHTGAMSGPFFRTHPLTLTWRTRVVRWVKNLWGNT